MGAFDDPTSIVIPDPNDSVAAEAFRKKWNWESHEQVIIRGTYTAGDMETVSNVSVISGKKGALEYQAGTARTKLLECMITDWTFSRNGMKVPVNVHSIKRLPYNYTTPILEECDKLASTLNEEEQEDFLDSVSEPSSVNSNSMKVVPSLL